MAIGPYAGYQDQSFNSVAIGNYAGYLDQSSNAIAIGNNAGAQSQNNHSIAIGRLAGESNQKRYSIAMGFGAGQTNQDSSSVAIGHEAGNLTQGANAVAVGHDAGKITQGDNCVAIGQYAGNQDQIYNAISIGEFAGNKDQSNNAIAIGKAAGQLNQGIDSIAIGRSAGNLDQGIHSVCLGSQAGTTTCDLSCVIINGSRLEVNSNGTSRCFIAPIRRAEGNGTDGGMAYDSTTKEVTFGSSKPFIIDHPIREDYKLIHCCVEGPQIDLIYRGKIKHEDGYGEINIDEKNGMTNGTFEALCRDIQSFTTNETGWKAVRSKVIGNILQIQSKDKESEDTISWMVIGERKDKGLIRDKKTDDEGKLITEQPNSIAGEWRSNC